MGAPHARLEEPALARDGAAAAPLSGPARLLSIDAFRGFVIAGMLLVNMTWDREVFSRQLFHVEWNDPNQGVTFADLVFPWFIFIAGAAIPLSMRSGRGRARPWWSKLLTAFRRGLVLYLLGVLLTVAGDAHKTPLQWTDLLRWNILQIIGASYFVALAICLLPRWVQVAFVVLAMLAKWAVMGLWPTDEPAGTWAHYQAVKKGVEAQLGWLGAAQQWLPGAAVAVAGGLVTELLTSRGAHARRTLLVAAIGAAATLLAIAWHLAPQPLGMAMSKWFFSPSYALVTIGTGSLLLAGFYYVADVRRLYGFGFLRVFGVNAIAVYVVAELSFKLVWSKWRIPSPSGGDDSVMGGTMAWLAHLLGKGPGLWLHITLYLLLCWLFCLWLYRKQIFIRV